MKKLFLLALAAIAPLCAFAQGTQVTPNVGLQIPAYGSSNWQIPLSYTITRIDQLLSGNVALPKLTLSGPITLAGPPTLPLQAATKGYVDQVAGSGNATQLQSIPICATAPTNGQQYVFNGTSICPASISASNATSLQSTPIATTAPSNGQVLAYSSSANTYGPVTLKQPSQRVVYTSVLLGTTGDATVAAGSSASGATDQAAAINAALAGGNIHLVVDGQYGLSTELLVASNSFVECQPGMGFIMLPSTNSPVIGNLHQNSPTTADSTGYGYVVSNIVDQNIRVRGCIFNAKLDPGRDWL